MLRILGVLVAVLAAQSATAQSTFSREDVRVVQERLADDDYDPGVPDGRFSQRTADAIRQYQSDWQLPQTGEITRELIDRLQRNHPATRPQWTATEDQGCKVWNPAPAAREVIFWTGGCTDGMASGSGRVLMRFFEQGRLRENSYEGEVKNGKAHGQGVITLTNGDRYEGEFRDGMPTGRGQIIRGKGADLGAPVRFGSVRPQGAAPRG